MADTEATPLPPTGRQVEYPNLRPNFVPGKSGNPSGVNRYMQQLRAAIQRQESPGRVCQVVDAMRTQALAGDKASPNAAKVYFQAVGLKLDGAAAVNVDLSDAPPEVMEYLSGKLH